MQREKTFLIQIVVTSTAGVKHPSMVKGRRKKGVVKHSKAILP